MDKKIKVGILGTGNIGTDLLIKIQRNDFLECSIFSGRNRYSNGVKFAKSLGINISDEGIDAFIKNTDVCDIIFDATSASAHIDNKEKFDKLNKFIIDLTPAKLNKLCVPVINLDECLNSDGVNLITCGGQATIPIAYAMSLVHKDIKYLEIVASIASKSAGSGTRQNIDEFTQTTKEALKYFTGVNNTKAIIILNPAEPPIIMRNTLYAIIDKPNIKEIYNKVHEMEKQIQEYVPGYRVVVGPIYENGRVTTTVEVIGLGDYLPSYSGNLDIITCAAIKIAQEYAIKLLNK